MRRFWNFAESGCVGFHCSTQRQHHAQSLSRLRAANGFADFSTRDRRHRSNVDVRQSRPACRCTGRRQQGQSVGQRRVSRAGDAGEQGRRSRSPPHRASGRRPRSIRWRRRSRTSCCSTIEVIRGTASDGKMSGGNLYPAPTLQVFPGETLIVHLENGLIGLTIRDYFSPQLHAEGRDGPDLSGADDLVAAEPSCPRRSRQPEGQCRQRPAAHPGRHVQHLHLQYSDRACRRAPIGITAICTASPRRRSILGLVGLLSIGRTDGNLPLVTQKQHSDPEHAAAIQFRLRSRRRPCAAQQSELAAIRQLDHAAARR